MRVISGLLRIPCKTTAILHHTCSPKSGQNFANTLVSLIEGGVHIGQIIIEGAVRIEGGVHVG